jgi:hypothetical protein
LVARPAAAQATTCDELCDLFPLPYTRVQCMSGYLQGTGFPVDTTPVCAVVETPEQCRACATALSVADAQCALVDQVCSQIGASPTTLQAAEGTALPSPVEIPVPTTSGAIVCGDGENCQCVGGQVCSQECTVGSCNMVCAGGSVCALSCPGGDCDLTCAGRATCTLDCAGGNCDSVCAGGATCTIDCAGGNCDCTGPACP